MRISLLLLALLLLSSCGGAGTLTFTLWGEDFIEQGIPANPTGEGGCLDGWSIHFSRFLVSVRDVSVGEESAASPAWQQAGATVFDLTKPGPVTVATSSRLPAGRWDRVSWTLGPRAGALAGPGVTPADLARMQDGALAVWVEGEATRGATSKRFAWAFPSGTRFDHCHATAFGGAGAVVPTGAEETVQLTVHGDHLFYDDLQSPASVMRFDALANADADQDGLVTEAELRAVKLTHLPVEQYGTAGAPDVKTLWDFQVALAHTLGHYRGEGSCVGSVLRDAPP